MSTPLRENEVILDGTKYHILGPVREQLVNPFPGKIVEGDVSRDDEQVLSSWVMTSFSGGLGIINGSYPSDQDRFNFATLETRYPRQLSLAPQVKRYSTDSLATLMFDYGSVFYTVLGKDVKSWDEDAQTFTLEHSLAADATDYAIFDGNLYLSVGDNFPVEVFDGADWYTVVDGSAVHHVAQHLISWNDSLYLMKQTGELEYTADIAAVTTTFSGTFTAAATLDLPPGSAKQLLIFYDIDSNAIICCVTDRGLYAFDLDASKFFPTPLTYPIHPNVGQGLVWRGILYVPVGATIYAYNNSTIQVVGPDRDEGLPSDYRGVITQIIGTHPFYYALVNAATDTSGEALNLIYTGSHRNTTFFKSTVSRALLLASPDSSWHGCWEEENAGQHIGCGAVSQANSTYRLWWGSGSGIYGIDLPTGLHNPLQNPTQRFQDAGSLTTPWFDANWAEIDKLAIRVKVVAEKVTATENYTLSAQWDESSDWQLIGNGTASGMLKFDIERGHGGRIFRRVRLKIDITRGSDASLTPVIHSIALSFDRVPPPIWAYQLTLDLSQDYAGQSVREMWQKLYASIGSRRAKTFRYRQKFAGEKDLLVRFSRQTGAFNTDDERGQAVISLLEIESRAE